MFLAKEFLISLQTCKTKQSAVAFILNKRYSPSEKESAQKHNLHIPQMWTARASKARIKLHCTLVITSSKGQNKVLMQNRGEQCITTTLKVIRMGKAMIHNPYKLLRLWKLLNIMKMELLSQPLVNRFTNAIFYVILTDINADVYNIMRFLKLHCTLQ